MLVNGRWRRDRIDPLGLMLLVATYSNLQRAVQVVSVYHSLSEFSLEISGFGSAGRSGESHLQRILCPLELTEGRAKSRD